MSSPDRQQRAQQFWTKWNAERPDAPPEQPPVTAFALALLEIELQAITAALPPTYYADRDLLFRVHRLVEDWKRAVFTNIELEGRLEELEKELYDTREGDKR